MTKMKPVVPKETVPIDPTLAAKLDLAAFSSLDRLDPKARCEMDGCVRNSDYTATFTPGFARRSLCAQCAEPFLEAVNAD